MDAIILCGGLGTRLRPVVTDRPKPLALVKGRPFLQYLIDRLRVGEIRHLVLAVSYLHEQISTCCGDGAHLGVEIRYSVELEPLGTAGAVKQAAELVATEDFLVLNGDTYVQVDYSALQSEHYKHAADLTLTLRQTADTTRYGCVGLDAAGRIICFGEKSELEGVFFINAGVYVMNRRALNLVPRQRRFSLETELLPQMLHEKRLVYGYPTTGYFRDIGIPEDYYRFISDVELGIIE